MNLFDRIFGSNHPPRWARIIIAQNEAILARLENRPCKLSPKDQELVDKIFDSATDIIHKVDDAEKKG